MPSLLIHHLVPLPQVSMLRTTFLHTSLVLLALTHQGTDARHQTHHLHSTSCCKKLATLLETCQATTQQDADCSQCLRQCNCHNADFLENDFNQSVAFTVELSETAAIVNNVHFTFDRVLIDTGSNIIPLLGVFDCPDDSWYLFMWSIHAPEVRLIATLVKNGEDIKYGPVTSEIDGSHSGSSSMASLLQCTAGVKVWLKAVGWPDTTSCNIVEEVYTSFTGFKVFDEFSTRAAFTAQLSANTSSSSYEPIVYDDVIVNVGGNYNSDTGEFTCTEDGIYLFIMSLHLATSSSDLVLRKNGGIAYYGPHAINSQASSRDTGTSTMTRLLECDAGDVITLTTSDARELLANANSWTGFHLYDPDVENTVAFHAHLSATTDFINGNVLIFDVDPVNIRGHYKKNFGTFICPDNDIYVFIWTVRISSESLQRSAEAQLMMADGETTEIKAGPRTSEVLSGSNSGSSSTQAVVRCHEGAAIYLQAVVADSNTQEFHVNSNNFIGFRLQ